MKRYISSLLIPCLLLQLFGCYSYRAITIDELKQYQGENDIRIKKDSTEIIINRKINRYAEIDWYSIDSSIVINKSMLKNYPDSPFVEKEKIEIPYSKILSAEIDEKDFAKTKIFSVAIVVVVLYAIAAIMVAQNGIDIGLHGNW